jgi:Zn-dependent protease with chaperone function
VAAISLLFFLALTFECGLPGLSEPALPFAILGLAMASGWVARFVAGVAVTFMAGRSLNSRSHRASIHGVDCRVVTDPSAQAFVLGLVRPRIYVTGPVITALDRAAQRAVLLHEDHHRRTRAPLRTLIIASWSDTIGRIPGSYDVLQRRLSRLEEDADRHALMHGARRSDLARALLAMEAHGAGTAFTGNAGSRIAALVGPAEATSDRRGSLPLEWLGATVIAAAALACLI